MKVVSRRHRALLSLGFVVASPGHAPTAGERLTQINSKPSTIKMLTAGLP
jgi:hypothetical protein